MKYALILLFLPLFGLNSCNEQQETPAEGKNRYLLKLDVERPNDIFIEVTDDSSMIVMRSYLLRDSSLKFSKFFPKLNGKLYERVFFTNEKTGVRDSIDLLMLSTMRDTSYVFDTYKEMSTTSFLMMTHLDRYVNIFPNERVYVTEVYSRKGSKLLPQRYVYNQDYTLLSFTSRSLFSDTLVFRNQSIGKQAR